MGKKLRDSLLQLLSYIKEGLETLNVTEPEEKIDLLQQMQQAVIYIGNTIEKTQKNTEEMIAFLSAFAERMYELSIDSIAVEIVKEECDRLFEVLQTELKVKFEILFLPYKSSMWDSLESIYKAAVEDTSCNVVVMPIPYYSVNEDRTALEENYEGTFFPEGIEITDYREYSIEERLPDVIFIHNPYDDKNLVTQIKPCFFSSELVKYTDRLVYVPYKVCSGKVKDLYCVLPGVKNAWRVFVQSEKVRDVYIKYQPKEKIIATGSPKIDKVIENAEKRPEITKEWEAVFKGKKVFLLNTHLNSLINYPTETLEKLKGLLCLFEGRRDVALLWRPHPLSIQTIKAMSPGILTEYQEIIEKCKKIENVVYDDTSEPHSAIACSDAYIGDKSSMVSMFGVTNKPIYIWSYNLKNIENDEKIFYETKRLKSIYYEEILSLEEYIELVCSGNDVRKELRRAEFEKIFYRTDGQSGKTIWEYVKKDLDEE